MAIEILEIPRITTPESVLGWFDDRSPGRFRLLHHGIDFCSGGNVMTERHIGSAGALQRQASVMGNTLARPKRQFQPRLKVKERNSAMLEFLADDAIRMETQAIAVERKRAVQISHAKRDNGDSSFHIRGLREN